MDIPWGSEAAFKFVTNVGLITSDGPHGPNVMAAEWTHHISYSPGLIAVCFGANRTTLDNIRAAKKFGISLAASDQNLISSVAGTTKGKEIDKISALKELGFKFYEGKSGILMVNGAALNAECRVVEEIQLGDHTMVVGEVIELKIGDKEPIAYHQGKYGMLDTNVQKPSNAESEKISAIIESHRKKIVVK